MLFSSTVFLFLFLPALLVAYGVAPKGARNGLLLTASLFFYAWGEVVWLGVLLGSIAANYALGRWLGGTTRRRLALATGIVANLLLLGVFKYADFATTTLNGVLEAGGVAALPLPEVHLPLGISFFTFQALSYLFDVYRGVAPVQDNPFRVALYISLFPQLIAGPIVRYATVAAALEDRSHSAEDTYLGLRRFVVGLAKKMWIANPLGETADALLAYPADELTQAAAWLAATCYALQIYFDFSGYSDMAIGLARCFGFALPENFEHPYTARSIREFWRRWHISLSTWFRDYLYIPLGGNRGGDARTAVNLLLVFFLCGLWHGASWNFVVWGLYHGAWLSLERTRFGAWLDAAWRPLQHLYLVVIVWLGWMLFRIEDWQGATAQVARMLDFSASGEASILMLHLDPRTVICLVLGAVGATTVPKAFIGWLGEKLEDSGLSSVAEIGGAAALLALAWLCAAAVAASTFNPFIYFRF